MHPLNNGCSTSDCVRSEPGQGRSRTPTKRHPATARDVHDIFDRFIEHADVNQPSAIVGHFRRDHRVRFAGFLDIFRLTDIQEFSAHVDCLRIWPARPLGQTESSFRQRFQDSFQIHRNVDIKGWVIVQL